MSVSAFSKREGIPAPNIHYWRKVRSRTAQSVAGRLRGGEIAGEASESPRIEFGLPNGIRVRVTAELSRDQLGEIMRAALSCSA